jgi:hypothetical protein
MAPALIAFFIVLSLTSASGYASPQRGGATAPTACSLLSVGDLAKLTERKELATARSIAGTGDEPAQRAADTLEPPSTWICSRCSRWMRSPRQPVGS